MKRKRIAFIAFLSVLCSNEAMAQTVLYLFLFKPQRMAIPSKQVWGN